MISPQSIFVLEVYDNTLAWRYWYTLPFFDENSALFAKQYNRYLRPHPIVGDFRAVEYRRVE